MVRRLKRAQDTREGTARDDAAGEPGSDPQFLGSDFAFALRNRRGDAYKIVLAPEETGSGWLKFEAPCKTLLPTDGVAEGQGTAASAAAANRQQVRLAYEGAAATRGAQPRVQCPPAELRAHDAWTGFARLP